MRYKATNKGLKVVKVERSLHTIIVGKTINLLILTLMVCHQIISKTYQFGRQDTNIM